MPPRLTAAGTPSYMAPTRSVARAHRTLEEDAVSMVRRATALDSGLQPPPPWWPASVQRPLPAHTLRALFQAFTPGNFQSLRTLPKIKAGFKPSPNTQRAKLNSPRRASMSMDAMSNEELWEMYHEEKTIDSA